MKLITTFYHIVAAIFLSTNVTVNAQDNPTLLWNAHISMQGSSSFSNIQDLHVSKDGELYSTGYFLGSGDFDPSSGQMQMVSAGNGDIFVSKMDESGLYYWSIRIGGEGNDQGNKIVTDAFGNIIIVGYFEGSVDFDPGAGVSMQTSKGNKDIFILKLDNDGNMIWVKTIGGSSLDEAMSVVLDNSNNIYVTGRFTNTVDFDPGNSTVNLSSGSFPDAFVCVFDSDGIFKWAFDIGSGDNEVGNAIDIDANGNIIVAGGFSGTVDFDPGSGSNSQYGAGIQDIFVASYSASGAFRWVHTFKGEGYEICRNIDIDSDNSIVLTGDFREKLNFNPSGPPLEITPVLAEDVFVAKISSIGTLEWAKSLPGNDIQFGYGVVFDQEDDIIFTGYFYSTQDCNPSNDVTNLISAGLEDIYVIKWSNDGDFIWAFSLPGSGSEGAFDVEIGLEGDVYICGSTFDKVDVDPNLGVVNITAKGLSDAFIAKYDQILTSTQDELVPDQISVFPNPCFSECNLIRPQSWNEQCQVKIYGNGGELVFENTWSQNLTLMEVNVSNLPQGVYIVEIISSQRIDYSKILVVK